MAMLLNKKYSVAALFLVTVAVFLSLSALIPSEVRADWICPDDDYRSTDQNFCDNNCTVSCDYVTGGTPPVPNGYNPATYNGNGNNGNGNNPGGNPFVQGAPYPHWLPPPPGSPIHDVGGVLGIMISLVETAGIIFWILTVAFGLYGAYLYLFAAGNKESAAQARKVLIYTVVAGILAIAAYGIPSIVEGLVFGF